MGCCWIDVRKFPWATKNPVPQKKTTKKQTKEEQQFAKERVLQFGNCIRFFCFFFVVAVLGLLQIRPWEIKEVSKALLEVAVFFFLLLLLLWVCRDLKFRNSQLAASSSSSSLTDFRLRSSGLRISSYFELLVITRFLCCDHLCVFCFFCPPFGLFIFLNLQSIWFLCFGIVARFCVSVCVGLSQLL